MREAVIVDAVRTPVGRGRPGGALSGWHPVDLLAHTLEGLVARAGVEPADVDDVIAGCVSQVGNQSLNIARTAVLAAGFPETVPATTIDRQCGSSQQALQFAAQAVVAGGSRMVIAAGVEVMSRVPLGSSIAGADPFGVRVRARYPDGLVPQGIAAELIAHRWGQTREELDEYAARSQQRACQAATDGRLVGELVPTPIDRGDDGDAGDHGRTLDRDEGLRPSTTVETLAELPPAFVDDDWRARLPELAGVIHAGNASQISDGAAAVLVAEREYAERSGLPIRAVVRGLDVVGDDPVMMLTGVIPVTRRVLDRCGLSIDDIDVFEINEAFASVVLAWLAETNADPAKVNVDGGAIANGHPLGASGAKLTTTLLRVLEESDGRYGLQAMCEGGGMANALVVERVV